MKRDLRDIAAAAICKFNVEIDENNNFVAAISPEECLKTCDYCRLFANFLCEIMNGDNDDK